jgi:hypothetical protein
MDRGKGYTSQQAQAAIQALAEDVKTALGPGGMQALLDLAEDAPGTLFHAMAVNELMRIYYPEPESQAAVLVHDVGKLSRPEIFAENGLGDMPFPGTSPIRAHVEYGKVLARYYELGPLMYAAINEHHGTLPFRTGERYLGTEPLSQFTATLMMADTVEAIHASGRLNETLLREIFEERQEQWVHIDEKLLWQQSQGIVRELLLNPELTVINYESDQRLQSPSQTLG